MQEGTGSLDGETETGVGGGKERASERGMLISLGPCNGAVVY